MSIIKHRERSVLGLLALLASAIFLLPASQAGAVTQNNACVNSLITTQSSLVPVTTTANASPNPVGVGGSITLSEIKQELAISPTVFVAGYNAGVLTTGLNEVPVKLLMRIIGTNTVEGEQLTNLAESVAKTTITDPDEEPGTADETATPGAVSVSYADQTWTAAAPGPIAFREKTQEPLTALAGGLQITAEVGEGGIIKVRFGCNPGTVGESAPPATIVFEEGLPFASVQAEAPAEAPAPISAPPAATPASENAAPTTKLKSTKVKKRKVTFASSSNEKGSSFLCKLDKKKFAKCKSPKTYTNLKPGTHKFQVKALDQQGKPDPSPVVKKFKIKK
jgi:hypothetical protein